MTFSMYGIEGTYNFGCEAIVRGTTAFLRLLYPDCKIQYYTYFYDYDRNILNDLNIEIVAIQRSTSIIKRGVNKVAREVGIQHRVLLVPVKKLIDNTDVLISIGGDIYTIPAYLRENEKYPYYNELIEVGKQIVVAGKKVIVYGASIGPFGNYRRAVNYYNSNLRKYELIICREKESIRYLDSLGLTNTMFMPDPAFLVHLKEQFNVKARNNKMIGLNFSPLSFLEVMGTQKKVDYDTLVTLVKRVIEVSGKDILLIPHVISPKNPSDNDLTILRVILEKMGEKYKERVHLADVNRGFLGIKEQIAKNCCLVASARMHCCINAIEQNIPTIFISYSKKSVGMCEYIYRNHDWVVDLKKVYKELFDKIIAMNNRIEETSKYLEKRNSEILKENRDAIMNIKVQRKYE